MQATVRQLAYINHLHQLIQNAEPFKQNHVILYDLEYCSNLEKDVADNYIFKLQDFIDEMGL